MTKQQIIKYQYCSEYLEELRSDKEKLPFGRQKFGCGSDSPTIEFELEEIHREMYKNISQIIKKAEIKVQTIIDKI